LSASISLIQIISLIGDHCTPCLEAQERPGLAGNWWRAWASAADNLGYIGAGIVGAFLAVVAGWYAVRWWLKKKSGVAA
jgi:high-affinity nickel-transport protein